MRVILFLSRFTFICNITFLLFVFFSWLEVTKPVKAISDRAIEVPFGKELIIILGFTAIFINLIMNVVYLFLLFSGKIKAIPRWLVIINFLFLLLQFFYFFYFK